MPKPFVNTYLCRTSSIYYHSHMGSISQMPQDGHVIGTVEFQHFYSINTKYGI